MLPVHLQKVIAPLVRRHVEDAAFYWLQHDAAGASPRLTLQDIARFSELLDAHLEGIEVAGAAGWIPMLAALERWKQPGEAFVCAYSALLREDVAHLDVLMRQVATRPDELLRGVISAIAWIPAEAARKAIANWTTLQSPAVMQVAALRALALIGQRTDNDERSVLTSSKPLAQALSAFLKSSDPHVRAAACRVAAIYPPDPALDTILKACMLDSDLAVRARAAIAVCRRTDVIIRNSSANGPYLDAAETLWQCIIKQVEQVSQKKGWYRKQALRRLDRWVEHLAWIVPMGNSQLPALLQFMPARVALRFIAFHGDLAYLPYVLGQLDDPGTTRYAGLIWQTLTGIDLRAAGLTAVESEEDGDMLITEARLDADLGLPLPNPTAVRDYRLHCLAEGGRHIAGQSLTPALAMTLLENSPQMQRSIASNYLLMIHPELNVETRGAAAAQMDSLDSLEYAFSEQEEAA